jgi:hypothetical protein
MNVCLAIIGALPQADDRRQAGAKGDRRRGCELVGFIWAIARLVEPKVA